MRNVCRHASCERLQGTAIMPAGNSRGFNKRIQTNKLAKNALFNHLPSLYSGPGFHSFVRPYVVERIEIFYGSGKNLYKGNARPSDEQVGRLRKLKQNMERIFSGEKEQPQAKSASRRSRIAFHLPRRRKLV